VDFVAVEKLGVILFEETHEHRDHIAVIDDVYFAPAPELRVELCKELQHVLEAHSLTVKCSVGMMLAEPKSRRTKPIAACRVVCPKPVPARGVGVRGEDGEAGTSHSVGLEELKIANEDDCTAPKVLVPFRLHFDLKLKDSIFRIATRQRDVVCRSTQLDFDFR